MAEGNAELRQRGLLLFGLVAVIAAVVLLVLIRWPSQATPQDPPAGIAPSAPGWEIRYQATIALARRGSTKVPFAILCEMLDENQQLRNFVTKLQNGKEVSDEGAARRTVIGALKAFVEWNKLVATAKHEDLTKVYEAIDKLRQSPNLELRAEVERSQLVSPKKLPDNFPH